MSMQYDFIDDSYKEQQETFSVTLSSSFQGILPCGAAVAAFEKIANDTEEHKTNRLALFNLFAWVITACKSCIRLRET